MLPVILLISLVFGAEARTINGGPCVLTLTYKDGDLKEPQPLILTRNGTTYEILYPQKKTGELTLESTERIILACPGKNNFIQGIPGLEETTEIEARCLKKKTFFTENNRLKFEFANVSCSRLPFDEARRTDKSCYGEASHVEIGFPLKKGFLNTIEICRDDETYSTFWTKFVLSKNIGAFHMSFPRPSWKAGEFYDGYKMTEIYKTKQQLETVAELVGSEELANFYIDNQKARFMAKGHLTAKADFVYGSTQMSTFWYLNAAPQWQTFNAGNWVALEMDVRQFAERKSLDLIVYTGTHGHMSLSDVNNNQVPVYLYVDGENQGIPVPRFFWKIIYDPVRQLGTAFIGVNDPYAEVISDDMFICEDIADSIKWLTWRPENIYKGVSYACSISDLREAVPSVPKLKVKGLLY